ncbi:hypothetical protein AcW1_004022 [Taiwanofungus camphoratus]|nr:hypothetical protein AcW1_004022 [Antrodia cinnamomea]
MTFDSAGSAGNPKTIRIMFWTCQTQLFKGRSSVVAIAKEVLSTSIPYQNFRARMHARFRCTSERNGLPSMAQDASATGEDMLSRICCQLAIMSINILTYWMLHYLDFPSRVLVNFIQGNLTG